MSTTNGKAITSRLSILTVAVLPIVLLVLSGVWIISSDPLNVFNSNTPPIEELVIERLFLDEEGIHLKVRAEGSEPITIAQIQIDAAYWKFTQSPSGSLSRLSSANILIPYPWVEGDAHNVVIVTNSGATFEREIEVALPSQTGRVGNLRAQATVGGFVGILPVAIGMMFFPLLVRLRSKGMKFVLSLTLGMLAFLLIDVLEDAFELAAEAASAFQGPTMVILIATTACLGLVAIGRRNGAPTGLALATFIALGIGLHNFGEGLAIGAAIAAGATSLGAFLILGFTIHNVTEGIAIVAPVVRKRPSIAILVALVLLAGAPAIPGIWLGSYAIEPHWAALALAIGAGAILQVLFEVGALTLRGPKGFLENLDWTFLSGFIFGISFMLLTGIVVKI
ncbi:metal transporter [Rhodobacterales bacterium 52_120_T64]|nr:metal transporter [Rhodobacterales bacterium 52_120_T64]